MHWIEARRGWLRAILLSILWFVSPSASLSGFAQQPSAAGERPPASNPPVSPGATRIPSMPNAPLAPVQPQFVVVIDAAHGGNDTGASISEHLLEKDVVLSLAVRLRSTLASRGIAVVTTRESDANVSPLNRA